MSSILWMGIEGVSEKLVGIYQTTCHHISEHCDFHGKGVHIATF